jgi:hypothetical protein
VKKAGFVFMKDESLKTFLNMEEGHSKIIFIFLTYKIKPLKKERPSLVLF